MVTRSIEQLSEQIRALPVLAPLLRLADQPTPPDTYLVGGSVRDLLLGREPFDIDLVTQGDPGELAERLGGPATTVTRFGTLTVQHGGLRYDIARTRRERYAQPGALPEVEPADIEADLQRRDFTVNAIAFGLLGGRAGEIVAAPKALDDLAARSLAVLHDQSFNDDPTRLLRLARYSARLGFAVAPRTRALAEKAIAAGALKTISGTRLGNELRLLAAESDPIAQFQAAADLGLPWSIDPALATRALAVLPPDGRSDLLILALALAPPSTNATDSAASGRARGRLLGDLAELGFTATDRDAVAEAATEAPTMANRLRQARSSSEIARSVGSAGIETVALASAHGATDQSLAWLNDLRHRQLAITGTDLIAAGVPEGPLIGSALAAARDALLDGNAPDRATQLEVALTAAR